VAKIAKNVLDCWTKGEKYLILGSMEPFIMYLSPYFPIAMNIALPSTILFDYPTACHTLRLNKKLCGQDKTKYLA